MRGLAVALAASPFRERLPKKIRERAIGVAVASLHASRITLAELQQLIEIAQQRGYRPWGLLSRWVDRGGSYCRQVLDEQRMKAGAAAAAQRVVDVDRARSAVEIARGEPRGYGQAPRLAGSLISSVLPMRAQQ